MIGPSSYFTRSERAWHYLLLGICCLVLLFLSMPILIVIPLSFNSVPFLSFPMSGLSLRWYEEVFEDPAWRLAATNTLIVGSATTAIATVLGTVAALGLSSGKLPFRNAITALLISPMIVPMVVIAVSIYFLFARLNLIGSLFALIIGHTLVATPFVVITVTSTLVGFDWQMPRAAASLGAKPLQAFFKVTFPLILPGIMTGALFAFVTSLDEVVIALFVAGPESHTLPREMWKIVRQDINPSVLAVACLLVVVSLLTLVSFEFLKRRNRRMRGLEP